MAGGERRPPRRFGTANVYAAGWTAVNYVVVHRRLKRDGVRTKPLPAPNWVDARAARGMHAVLRRTSATCLEGALIRQEWFRAHGRSVEVIIGVNTADAFRAHAWLSSDGPQNSSLYQEIHRMAAPGETKGRP